MALSVHSSTVFLIASVLSANLLACSSGEADGGTGGAATGGAATGGAATGGAATGGAATGGGGVGATGATGSGGVGATGATGSGGTASDPTIPTDTTREGLSTWLATQSYRSAPWVGDAAVRTPATGTGNPHGNGVRAYLNPTAVASIEAGKNDISGDGNSLGSVGVKEFYDETGAQVGVSLFMRNAEAGGFADWLYYCQGSGTVCTGTAGDTDVYGQGANECRFCHSGVFFSDVAINVTPE